jgi:hypothetical protein
MDGSSSFEPAASRCRQRRNVGRGAYGLQVVSAVDVPDLTEAARTWSELTIVQDVRVAPPPVPVLDERRAVIVMSDTMHAEIDRETRSATVVTDREWPPAAFAHPFLAAPGMVFAWWDRREPLHGGAYLAGDGAWVLLAPKGGGKSTTLGALADRGVPVVADDLVVVESGSVLAGPRCVDLVPAAAAQLGIGDARFDARSRKVRISLAPVAPAVPLLGFVHLAWGDGPKVVGVKPADRAARLVAHRSLALEPTARGGLLDLVRLPTYELRRPRDLASLAAVADLLLGLGA